MTKVAFIGYGFMGRVHAACWQRIRGVRVAAVCVRNPASLARSVKVYGCVGEALPANLPSEVAVYTDAEKMLDEVKPDVVDVVLPTSLHAAAVERALAHGAHVLCEKPLARDAREADRILRAAARAKGRFMVAQCLRFAPEYVYLKKLVDSNRYGAVTAATFTRLTPPPCAPDGKSWFQDESVSGGLALDLNIHDADIVNWIFGLPTAVSCRAHRVSSGALDHLVASYDYPDKIVVSEASWSATESFGFTYGFRVHFARATVVYDPRLAAPFMVYPARGKPFAPAFRARDPYQNEIAFFHRLATGRVRPEANPAPLAEIRASLALVDAERASARTGRARTSRCARGLADGLRREYARLVDVRRRPARRDGRHRQLQHAHERRHRDRRRRGFVRRHGQDVLDHPASADRVYEGLHLRVLRAPCDDAKLRCRNPRTLAERRELRRWRIHLLSRRRDGTPYGQQQA